MLILITGGSGSGKSSFAESLICRLAEEKTKYYIATMQAYDEESRRRVLRHRKAREGKGFCTVEQPVRIELAASKIKEERGAALVECMSNLTANEMFAGHKTDEKAGERILSGMEELDRKLELLVVVTNNVFEDGICYDPDTTRYLQTLGQINQSLARRAQLVVEVVAGIPLVVKDTGQKGRAICQ